MKTKHYNIPIFIPELACPFQCIYCNQKKISGQLKVLKPEDVKQIIDEHLTTIPYNNSIVNVAFFGGNFTGIPLQEQEEYLKIVQPYLSENKVHGIRLSTRPDYINNEVLDLLKKYNVTTIELGAQSMKDDVLRTSRRGHKVADTIQSSEKIKSYGFSLGLQMMVGLPGDNLENAVFTAKKIVELGADNTRIYPCIIIKDTKLEEYYYQKKYFPLTLDEAITQVKKVYLVFEKAGLTVLRIGLHPSENLLKGNDLIAGPFHQSFKELVFTEIWKDILLPLTKNPKKENIEIFVSPTEFNYAIGYNSKNKKLLKTYFKKLSFKSDVNLIKRNYRVNYY